MSNEQPTTNQPMGKKPPLYIKSGASRGLKIVYNFYKIVFFIIPFAIGVVFIILGLVSNEPAIGIMTGLYIIISSLILLIFLQVLNSLVVRTRAAEYYVAEMEEKYDIRR